MTDIDNFEQKATALRKLVADAVHAEQHPLEIRNVHGPEFDGFTNNFLLKSLANVLKTTDALYVLDRMLSGGDNARIAELEAELATARSYSEALAKVGVDSFIEGIKVVELGARARAFGITNHDLSDLHQLRVRAVVAHQREGS